ncbi:protein artemis-like [Bolinopsis microptera]|uniref:protein artemis-like n=1 Tax=Bolinopsis microptera TaxID=2820187 RepID=UPI00307A57B5
MANDVFQGKIEGFPEISVDYFVGSRLKSYCFFLSHCHTDHIKGLDSQEFKSLLQHKQVKIYCTKVTASLVLRRSKLDYLASSFVFIEKDESYTLHVSPKETINVTIMDAHHCPGSVMFLFSRDGDASLYTGDFRVTKDIALNSAINNVQLKSLYIDTTFFSPKIPKFHDFPSRKESEDAVVRFVLREKEKNDSVVVHIDVTPGWENIFIALANHFDCDVQALENLYNQYSDIEDIMFYLTLNKSWLHINQTNSECTLCNDTTLKLRPSIQWKLHNNMMNNDTMIAAKAGVNNSWYVTHSMHSSYSECCSFIEQVSADKVFPIATPPNSSNEQITAQLKKFWKKSQSITPAKSTNFKSDPSNLLNNKEDYHPQCEETFDDVDVSSESDDCLPILLVEAKAVEKIEAIEKEIEDKMNDTHRRNNSTRSTKINTILSSDEPSEKSCLQQTDLKQSRCRKKRKHIKKSKLSVKKKPVLIISSSSSESDDIIIIKGKDLNKAVTNNRSTFASAQMDDQHVNQFLKLADNEVDIHKSKPKSPGKLKKPPKISPDSSFDKDVMDSLMSLDNEIESRKSYNSPSDVHVQQNDLKILPSVGTSLGVPSSEKQSMDMIMSQYFDSDSN